MTKPTGAENTGGLLTKPFLYCRNSMARTDLTAERLRELFHYDPETGVFTWLINPRNQRIKGCSAGTVTSQGYVAITIDGIAYRANRLVWMYIYGVWPVQVADHINGNRTDNRVVNLRDISHADNTRNIRSAKSTSSSQLLGAFKSKYSWRARIMVDGKRIGLGAFKTAELAHAAYLAAKKIYHPICT